MTCSELLNTTPTIKHNSYMHICLLCVECVTHGSWLDVWDMYFLPIPRPEDFSSGEHHEIQVPASSGKSGPARHFPENESREKERK